MLQLLRYLAVGGVNTVLGYAIIFGTMYFFGAEPLFSNAVGYGVCLALSFFLNKKFTFASTGDFRREAFPFFCVFISAYIVNFCTVFIFVYLLDVSEWISQLVGGVFYIAISFFLNKFYVFKPV